VIARVDQYAVNIVPAGGHDVAPIKFKASIVVAADGKVIIALFDGAHSPSTVAVLRCSREAAVTLKENLSSALSAKPF
jgi:hypothetical protein